MEIKKLNFEKTEIQMKEIYIDEEGRTKERIKTILISTGNVIPDEEAPAAPPKKDKE